LVVEASAGAGFRWYLVFRVWGLDHFSRRGRERESNLQHWTRAPPRARHGELQWPEAITMIKTTVHAVRVPRYRTQGGSTAVARGLGRGRREESEFVGRLLSSCVCAPRTCERG
jgi:hypothetical protein